jgi:hypothetical protein
MTERFDVFVSHSSQDKPWVRRLATDLERHGVKVVDLLADATPGLAHDNAELARQLSGAGKSLMQSVTRMRFAGGTRRRSAGADPRDFTR